MNDNNKKQNFFDNFDHFRDDYYLSQWDIQVGRNFFFFFIIYFWGIFKKFDILLFNLIKVRYKNSIDINELLFIEMSNACACLRVVKDCGKKNWIVKQRENYFLFRALWTRRCLFWLKLIIVKLKQKMNNNIWWKCIGY